MSPLKQVIFVRTIFLLFLLSSLLDKIILLIIIQIIVYHVLYTIVQICGHGNVLLEVFCAINNRLFNSYNKTWSVVTTSQHTLPVIQSMYVRCKRGKLIWPFMLIFLYMTTMWHHIILISFNSTNFPFFRTFRFEHYICVLCFFLVTIS